MQTDQTANPAALDPGRLRHITRSFAAIRNGGLNTFLLGLLLFLFDMSHLFHGLVEVVLTLLGVGCSILMLGYVAKYYERRFGHIESIASRGGGRMSRAEAISWLVALGLLGLLFIAFVIGSMMPARSGPLVSSISNQLHAAISDPEHRVNLSPVLFLIGVSLTYALRSLLGLFQGTQSGERRTPTTELRVGYLALIICSAAALYPLHNPGITRFLLWKVLAFGWLGITLMAEGIYEHLTLIQLFPKRPDYDTDPS